MNCSELGVVRFVGDEGLDSEESGAGIMGVKWKQPCMVGQRCYF